MMKKKIAASISLSSGLLLVTGLLLLFQLGPAKAQGLPDQAGVIEAGIAYLQTQQQADGGITGFSGVSDPDTTARSVIALIAAGNSPRELTSSAGNSTLDYLATQAVTFTHDTTGTLFPGRAGLLITAVKLAGEDGSGFGGMDLAGELETSFQPDTGAYSTTAKSEFSSGSASDLSQAWAILGLGLDGREVPEAATNYLIQSQAGDGSWGAGDPDTTALAVTALLASGNVTNQGEAIQKAIQYFHDTQASSGGWKPSWDTDPLNADSTGWILEALVSAGEDIRGQSWNAKQANPLDALMSLQKPDGSIGGTYANSYSTAEAIIGLAGIPLTNLANPPANHRAGLVIYYGDDSLFTTCVSFTESTLSGLQLLERSGLAIQTATNPNQGTAVCKIGDVGSPSSDCFGSMPDYWSYWQMGANGWDYAVTGSDQAKVSDGAVNAWSWGTGNPPALINFQNTCEGVAIVLPTSAPPTGTPAPTATTTIASATLPPIATATPTPAGTQKTPGGYIVYASILLVLGVLIIYLFRSRSK
jgi:Prenyltransferase and squalene oxidase repeat